MLTLNDLLHLICDRTNLHICIHDISGILEQNRLRIDSKFKTHTKQFCSIAKSTVEGYSACVSCKDRSNRRAADGEEFSRICPYGMFEIIRPVKISGKVRCIIYLGNLTQNREALKITAAEFCKTAKLSPELILNYVDEAEIASDGALSENGYYAKLADFIRDFITELFDVRKAFEHDRQSRCGEHWCVRLVREYIEMNLASSMTLSSIAGLYFINEKYLGRIFRRQTGKTFHQYLTDLRLERSAQLLESNGTILSAAQECGFQNVTYFNKCFKKRFGMSPSQYRKELKG